MHSYSYTLYRRKLYCTMPDNTTTKPFTIFLNFFSFLLIKHECLTHEKTAALLRDWIDWFIICRHTSERDEYDIRVDVRVCDSLDRKVALTKTGMMHEGKPRYLWPRKTPEGGEWQVSEGFQGYVEAVGADGGKERHLSADDAVFLLALCISMPTSLCLHVVHEMSFKQQPCCSPDVGLNRHSRISPSSEPT